MRQRQRLQKLNRRCTMSCMRGWKLREREKEPYRLVSHKDLAGKSVQQVRVNKGY